MINHPTIVLTDEPTGNLDSITAETIIQLMKSMARKLNQTFIVVTHEKEVFGDVDRVITIKDGQAFDSKEPKTLEVIT